ncbi:MAG TPA: metallophosphoesterase [Acidiferrobacter sp.]|nr:metallophosphoesterase [Acidiferrobacter sp.]
MIFPFFLALYGLGHALIWYAVVSGLQLLAFGQGLLALILLALAAAPFLARRLERRGYIKMARVFAWAGYTWAGLVLFFVLARVVTDVLVGLADVLDPHTVHGTMAFSSLLVTGLLTVVLAAYAFIERSRIRVETIDVPTAKGMGELSLLRVAQISDVHIGSMNGRRRVRTIVRRLNELHPDVVVSTGDLVDSRTGFAVSISRLLAMVQPPLGKFAVIGNHEYYAGLPSSLAFMERSGFTVLRNSAVSLRGINLVGMDDPATGRPAQLAEKEVEVLRAVPAGVFTILLKHRPDLVRGSQARFDLQLSGHTHKGQMFPLGLVTRLYYPTLAGLFRLARTSYLYVSRGTGTWGPPFRLLATPEITVFTIGPGRPDPGGQRVPAARAAASGGAGRRASAPAAARVADGHSRSS